MKRLLRLIAATTLALGSAVAFSGAASAAPTCDEGSGYGSGGVCGISAEVKAVCTGDLPTLTYATTGATGTTVTVTFVNPGGTSTVYTNQPLSGSVVWPGTVVNGGKVTDWPGWTKGSDGTWTKGDAYDWSLNDVQVVISDGADASTVASYPTVGCAPTNVVSDTKSGTLPNAVLASTGATVGPLVGIAAALVVIGTGVLLVSRRRRNV
ncbi:MAG: LPXTG cell wall anchor domain-containing protein [Actinomycetales bacterium]|nr:LPXTG cell wall anchor domain-containing protein [Actinomycetales bacterium]